MRLRQQREKVPQKGGRVIVKNILLNDQPYGEYSQKAGGCVNKKAVQSTAFLLSFFSKN